MPLAVRVEDRRTYRTRRAAGEALIELILEKDYDTITIQDVLDRAGVGRTTFYAHYRSKEDLLHSHFEDFLDRFDRHVARNRDGTRLAPVAELFGHLKDFHPLYRALARSRKLDALFRVALTVLSRNLEARIAAQLPKGARPAVPSPIVARHVAGALLTMLRWWLDHNMPLPAERMDEIFQTLVMHGVRGALAARSAAS